MQNSINLSPRLQLIADKVVKGSKIADIGTDHAYIPIYLMQNGIIEYAVASDVRKGPVQKAKQNVEKYKFTEKIDVRLGDGLEKVNAGEVDTVIIAGMGGVLITQILSDAFSVLQSVKRLILQPMVGQEEVRKWLVKNDYKIIDEELAMEGDKIYNVIVAEHGQGQVDKPIYYYIGKKLIENRDPLLGKLLNQRINELENIMRLLKDKPSANAVKRLDECKGILFEYQRIKKAIGSGDSNEMQGYC